MNTRYSWEGKARGSFRLRIERVWVCAGNCEIHRE